MTRGNNGPENGTSGALRGPIKVRLSQEEEREVRYLAGRLGFSVAATVRLIVHKGLEQARSPEGLAIELGRVVMRSEEATG